MLDTVGKALATGVERVFTTAGVAAGEETGTKAGTDAAAACEEEEEDDATLVPDEETGAGTDTRTISQFNQISIN